MGAVDFKELQHFIPYLLVEQITNTYFKEMLHSIYFLQTPDDKFIKQLGSSLESRMYQPYDNIITQGELGQEAYFLIEGVAHVVQSTVQNVQVQVILEQGDYFGEKSLLNICIRKKSVIAASYCSRYILKK